MGCRLNCRKDDLAFIVSATTPETLASIGHVCRCVEQVNNPISGEPGWLIDPPVQIAGEVFPHCLDRVMRPIRDPGEDAVDQMVLLCGLPQEVAA